MCQYLHCKNVVNIRYLLSLFAVSIVNGNGNRVKEEFDSGKKLMGNYVNLIEEVIEGTQDRRA
jgi:hypothetical protein